ncbi:hypothetical protein JKP88DRAFT_219239 [Tribonema minus]|uniref:Uncharacterized protein n=1 Tax=Tribonema minus TaxID=303371 RepID=A0A835Z301_9STRA|nr:hypothetical protein JKP88DRAFT_219239 [Tribonema minus]
MIGQSTCTVALFCILCACASAKSLRGGRHQQRRLKISPDYQGTPYEANPIAIPGMLQVELFDKGGEGVGYHDIKDPAAKAKAPPNVIRQDSPIQINDEGPDVNGSEAVGQIGIGMGIGGEWLRYTIEATETATYRPIWRIATYDPKGGDNVVQTNLALGTGAEANPCTGDLPVAGGLDIKVNTGGYKTFKSYTSKDPITIPKGAHVLTVCLSDVVDFEMNYIDFEVVGEGGATEAPSAAPSIAPSVMPSAAPSDAPSAAPSAAPVAA